MNNQNEARVPSGTRIVQNRREGALAWVGQGVALLLVAMLAGALQAQAQEPAQPDTTLEEVVPLEEVVVTAERSALEIMRSTAAVSVIDREALRRQPTNSLADALTLVPGFTFLEQDGLGYAPQPVVRGFYGGGEAEYVQVLLDGRPLNEMERGLIDWNLIPPEQLDEIEVMRGGASSLYGDAAIGGVVNLTMDPERSGATRLGLRGGSYGTGSARLYHSGRFPGGRAYSVFGNAERTGGYREDAERRQGTVGGRVALLPDGRLRLSTLHHGKRADQPGPLSGSAREADRRQVAPFYRFDETEERRHQAALSSHLKLAPNTQLRAYLSGRLRRTDVVETRAFGPTFADTRNRVLDVARTQGSVQFTFKQLPLPVRDELTVGTDLSYGALDSREYAFLRGNAEAYEQAQAERGDELTRGENSRLQAAAFAQYDLFPTERLRLSLGARFDALRDRFDARAPSPDAAASERTTHTAFSPRGGANYRYLRSERQKGHVYANVSRVFKAPTLDQLYNQRTYQLDPDQQIKFFSPALDPQRGTSYEAGLYHRAQLWPEAGVSGALSLAIYQIDMRDELDFNLQELRYVNVGKSRHRGVEAGLKLFLPGQTTLRANYTRQDVTLQNGEYEGNAVKAIPRDVFTAGVSAAPEQLGGLSGSVLVNTVSGTYLDDPNTIRLPGHTTVGARLAYEYGVATVSLEAQNLFGATYSTTGFPDPLGADQVYYYPAAGRTLTLGLTTDL
ncbi:MAG: hypothetical protein BRD44_08245 [Bacteroidetes bacterium QS_7_67_15]|nr:MAG: hypothetical protein BRD44_08245 [Bacteroidetes bacterium QS_7_67_15]